MKESKIPRRELILLTAGLLGLVALQLIFPRAPFYDEDDYLLNIALLHKYGLGKNYLVNLIGSAGPLYSVVHFIFEPLTGLKAPYIRLVNTGFLVGVTWFTYRTLYLLNFSNRFYALFVMAIPMTYVIAGLALTEMPAIFFFTAAIYLIIKSMSPAPGKYVLPQLIIGGLCISLAILGRQPFLLTLAALPVLFISKENYKKNIVLLAITLLFSVALPCYVFVIWRGLVPTIESQLYIDIAHAGISYRPDFFLLCVFYFSVSMLLISPAFLRPPGKNALLRWSICFAAITIANFIFNWIALLPAKPWLEKMLANPRLVYTSSILCGSAVIFLGLYFTFCVYKNLQAMQYPKELVFFTASLLLVAAACIKITWGFSSRYAAQAIPLIVLTGSYTYKNSKYNPAGIVIGILTGLMSLFTYFTGV
jgi:hypothetical protein